MTEQEWLQSLRDLDKAFKNELAEIDASGLDRGTKVVLRDNLYRDYHNEQDRIGNIRVDDGETK